MRYLAGVLLCMLGFVVISPEVRAQHHGVRTTRGHVAFQPQVRGMGCLRPKARMMIAQLTRRIGQIQITSTCGGRHAHNSQHYRGNAVDFRPLAVTSGTAVRVLHSMPFVGGVGSYGSGLVHADVGDRIASWYVHGLRHRHFASHHRRNWYVGRRSRRYAHWS